MDFGDLCVVVPVLKMFILLDFLSLFPMTSQLNAKYGQLVRVDKLLFLCAFKLNYTLLCFAFYSRILSSV